MIAAALALLALAGTEPLTPPTDRAGGADVHRRIAEAVYTGVGGYGTYAR